jgi:hypothetical protein
VRTAAIAGALWLWASAAAAQGPTEALYVTGQVDFLQSDHGGAAGVEWLRKNDVRGLHGGAQAGSLDDAWWTYGRAGGFTRWQRVVLSGALDAGGGTQQGGPFGYLRLSGGLATAVGSRFVLESEAQLARMAGDVRRILRLGFTWRIVPGLTAGTSSYAVFADGSTTPAVSGRVDIERGRSSALGGIVLTRRDGSAALVSHLGPLSLTSTEFFGGAGFRVRSYRLQVVANIAHKRTDPSRVLATLEIPLER